MVGTTVRGDIEEEGTKETPMLFLLLAACGGQSGEEQAGASCEARSSTPLGADEASPGGFTPAEVAAGITAFDGAFTWAVHDPTTLALTPTVDLGSAAWVDYELASDGSGIEPAIFCEDGIELDVAVDFVTADGRFDEAWTWTAFAGEPTTATAWAELDVDALGGTYVVEEVDLADYDDFRAFVSATWTAGVSAGTVDGQATTEGDPDDPDSTASATNVPIASW